MLVGLLEFKNSLLERLSFKNQFSVSSMSAWLSKLTIFVTDMGVIIVSKLSLGRGVQTLFQTMVHRLYLIVKPSGCALPVTINICSWMIANGLLTVSEWFFKPQAPLQPLEPSRSSSSNSTQLPLAATVQNENDTITISVWW